MALKRLWLQAASNGNASAANVAAQAATLAMASAKSSAKDFTASGASAPAHAEALVTRMSPAHVGYGHS